MTELASRIGSSQERTVVGTHDARMEAAERYERDFVPSAFLESALRLANRAQVGAGHRVLDVGCGTGVVARECAQRVGAAGSVTGLDVSAEMLAVAHRVAPSIAWVRADAGSLPFPPASFDRILSQFALMFFPDRIGSVREMWRVLAPGGKLAVSVSGRLHDSPINVVLAELIERQVGKAGRDIVNGINVLGHPADIETTFAAAGVDDFALETAWGLTRSPSLDDFVETEIRGWGPLSELFDEASLAELLEEARRDLAFCVTGDGGVEFQSSYHTISATKTEHK